MQDRSPSSADARTTEFDVQSPQPPASRRHHTVATNPGMHAPCVRRQNGPESKTYDQSLPLGLVVPVVPIALGFGSPSPKSWLQQSIRRIIIISSSCISLPDRYPPQCDVPMLLRRSHFTIDAELVVVP